MVAMIENIEEFHKMEKEYIYRERSQAMSQHIETTSMIG